MVATKSGESGNDCDARNSALLRAIPDAIYRIEPNGVIVDYKPRYYGDAANVHAESLIGSNFFSLASTESAGAALRDAALRSIATGELQCLEYEAPNTAQRAIHEARFVAEETGRVVVIVRDLSEQRRNDENLARIEKLEALGMLAGGIAHDFNNLVAGSFGHVEMAREYIIEDKATRAVDCLNEAARLFNRARELTRQLLTFSKGGTPHKAHGDLVGVVRAAVNSALDDTSFQLQFEAAPQLPAISFDAVQLTQVVENLVTNAKQAMPAGGVLEVTIRASDICVGTTLPLAVGSYVCVSIKDHGEGIPLENMPKLFDPFFTTRPTGTGLGLASSFSIVKRHGGHLDVQSELGNGTDCSIYLPVDVEGRVELARPLTTRQARQGRVLVMDDEDSVRGVTSAYLMRLGYEVTLAADGGEAIDIYRRTLVRGQQFAFVILDLTVPGGLGGRETLESLREIDAGVMAIATSGYSNDPILAHPENYGFRASIAKPYSRQEFLGLIARIRGA